MNKKWKYLSVASLGLIGMSLPTAVALTACSSEPTVTKPPFPAQALIQKETEQIQDINKAVQFINFFADSYYSFSMFQSQIKQIIEKQFNTSLKGIDIKTSVSGFKGNSDQTVNLTYTLTMSTSLGNYKADYSQTLTLNNLVVMPILYRNQQDEVVMKLAVSDLSAFLSYPDKYNFSVTKPNTNNPYVHCETKGNDNQTTDIKVNGWFTLKNNEIYQYQIYESKTVIDDPSLPSPMFILDPGIKIVFKNLK